MHHSDLSMSHSAPLVAKNKRPKAILIARGVKSCLTPFSFNAGQRPVADLRGNGSGVWIQRFPIRAQVR
jgi:hypothetical protein